MLKIIYFGSPDISAKLLHALILEPQFQVCAVISNPDRPIGRSNQPRPTPVASQAIESNIPLFCYTSLKGEQQNQVLTDLKQFDADVGVVFAYGSIIPESIFSLPKLGSVNLHGSLLPLLRGASPIHSAILGGFTTTGWTLQKLAKRMDAGDILATTKIDIEENEIADELLERMLPLGIDLMIDSLKRIQEILTTATAQDESKATYCSKLHVDDSWIDWQGSSIEIHNKIRALNSAVLARSINLSTEKQFLFHRSEIPPDGLVNETDFELKPGQIIIRKFNRKKRLLVRTGSGFLEIIELQLAGRKRMNANDCANGGNIEDGIRFGKK